MAGQTAQRAGRLGGRATRRRTARRTAAAGGVVVAVLLGGAAAWAAESSSSAPTGLCLSDGGPVTAARPDGSGWSCPSGRTLVVVAAQEAVRVLASRVDTLEARVDSDAVSSGTRFGDVEQRITTTEQALRDHDAALSSLGGELAQASGRLDDLDSRVGRVESRLGAVESGLAALQRSTAVSTRTVAASFAATSSPRTTVSCGSGTKALSGSARTAEATLTQSAVADDGSSWVFDLRATGKAPAATLLVVCQGTAGPTGPVAQPPSGPTTAPAPGTTSG